jgi:hypothetical protein
MSKERETQTETLKIANKKGENRKRNNERCERTDRNNLVKK